MIMDYKARTKVSRILIDEAVPVGGNVIILGWVRTVRSSKEVAFVEVNDGSCMKNIQGVIQQPESFPVLEHVLTGASVRLEGKLVPSGGKGQKYEVAVSRIDLIGQADASYPLQKKRHTNEFLREIAHLRPRTNTFGAVNRIRSKMASIGARLCGWWSGASGVSAASSVNTSRVTTTGRLYRGPP